MWKQCGYYTCLPPPPERIFSIWIGILRLELNFLKIIHGSCRILSTWFWLLTIDIEVQICKFLCERKLKLKTFVLTWRFLRRNYKEFLIRSVRDHKYRHFAYTFPAVAGILARFPFDSSKPVFSESIAFYASRQCGFRLLSLCYNDSLLFRNRLISAQSRWFIPNVCAKPIHAARSGFSTCADRTQDFTCR